MSCHAINDTARLVRRSLPVCTSSARLRVWDWVMYVCVVRSRVWRLSVVVLPPTSRRPNIALRHPSRASPAMRGVQQYFVLFVPMKHCSYRFIHQFLNRAAKQLRMTIYTSCLRICIRIGSSSLAVRLGGRMGCVATRASRLTAPLTDKLRLLTPAPAHAPACLARLLFLLGRTE